MTPEERLEQQLRFDPDHYFKQWRYAEWRYEMAKAKADWESREVRMLVVRKMLKEGSWE